MSQEEILPVYEKLFTNINNRLLCEGNPEVSRNVFKTEQQDKLQVEIDALQVEEAAIIANSTPDTIDFDVLELYDKGQLVIGKDSLIKDLNGF